MFVTGSASARRKGIRASEQPMFYAAMAFSAGICMAHFAWRPPLWWAVAALSFLLAAAALLRKNGLAAFVIALGSLVAAGALSHEWNRAARLPAPKIDMFTEGETKVVGHVSGSGLVRARGSDYTQTLDLETEEIDGQPVRVGIRVTVYSETEGTAFAQGGAQWMQFGDRLSFSARLREPRNFGNPGAMDYRGYLEERGVRLLAWVKAERIDLLPGKVGTPLEFWRSRARLSLVQHMLALQSPEWTRLSREDVGLLTAMIIGEQSLIRRDTKTEFQRTGVFHVLVVSGMNVGILAFVIFTVAKWLRTGEAIATAVTIILVLLYAYMTDLGAPILRATVMLSLYLATRLLYRDRYSLNPIGTAALALLAWEPLALFDASFQLTFLSVTALGGITQPLIERTSQPYSQALYGLDILGYDATLQPKQAQFRLDLRMISERLARVTGLGMKACSRVIVMVLRAGVAAFNLMLVTVVLQFALALPMVYYFHRVALIGSLANMMVIPLASLLLPLGIVATLLSHLSPTAAYAPSVLTALVLHAITGTVSLLGGTQFAELRIATPAYTTMLFAAAAYLFAIFTMRRHRYVAAAGLVMLGSATVWMALPPSPRLHPEVLEVTVLDVGQGDSILVVSPEGRTLLIDGGGPLGFVQSDGFEIGEDVVSPYLWSRGITRLDAVALSHAHSDHMGGLRSVIANFRPAELWVGAEANTSAYHALTETARTKGTRVVRRNKGDVAVFGQMHMRVLAPSRTSLASGNDESLVLEIRYRNTSALLMGDAERTAEKEIARAARPVDLLKVAHHGSATSTTPELLASTRPQFAAISAGHRNVYGHPKPEIIRRLTAAGVRTLRTDLQGALTFYLDGERVKTTTFAEWN
jgi:competence protein ComEC